MVKISDQKGPIPFGDAHTYIAHLGGAVASWLVRLTPDRDLAGDIALCSWTRHLTLIVPLSAQVYIKMGTGEFNAGGNSVMD